MEKRHVHDTFRFQALAIAFPQIKEAASQDVIKQANISGNADMMACFKTVADSVRLEDFIAYVEA